MEALSRALLQNTHTHSYTHFKDSFTNKNKRGAFCSRLLEGRHHPYLHYFKPPWPSDVLSDEHKAVIVASPQLPSRAWEKRLGGGPSLQWRLWNCSRNEKNRRPKAARKGSRRWDVSTDCRVLSEKVKSSGRESPRPRTSQQTWVQISAMPFSDCAAAMT